LQAQAIDMQLLVDVIDWVDVRAKKETPPGFHPHQIHTDPYLRKISSILLQLYDSPFLWEDRAMLKKIYMLILHIQELKAAMQHKLEAGIQVQKYYRTDLISRQWIQDNRESIYKLMQAFEKAAFTDSIISPPEWLDEVARREHYDQMRSKMS